MKTVSITITLTTLALALVTGCKSSPTESGNDEASAEQIPGPLLCPEGLRTPKSPWCVGAQTGPVGDSGFLCCSLTIPDLCVENEDFTSCSGVWGYCKNYTKAADGSVTCHDE